MAASRSKTNDISKTSGSKRICQERFSCNGSKAEYNCWDCGTRQCVECEKHLHERSQRFSDHDRDKISQIHFPGSVQLCDLWCNPVNSAEYFCIECTSSLCSECNKAFHRGKYTKHHRRAIVNKTNPPVASEDLTHKATTSTVTAVAAELYNNDGLKEIRPTCNFNLQPRKESNSVTVTSSSSTCSEEDFLSAIGIDSLSAWPIVNQVQNFIINTDDIYSAVIHAPSPARPIANTMEEMSSNEFGSLEDALEKCMMDGKKSELNADDPSAMLVREPHSLPFSSRTSHFDQTVTSQRSNKPLNREGKQQKSEDKCTVQRLVPQTTSPKTHLPTVASNIRNTPAPTTRSENVNTKPRANVSLSTVPVPKERSIASANNKPIASIMGTSQNQSTSSAVGDADSLRGSLGHQMMRSDVAGALREDGANLQPHPQIREPHIKHSPGFLLVDDNENLKMDTVEQLTAHLGCSPTTPVKVVSIFGNTGDGKSHTLNHTFFNGQDVFSTSTAQDSCTIGIWAAYDSAHSLIVADTEGLQGVSTNENQRTRLLLKVLAISDVVVYRTRADRLHRDLFQFLGDASKAYCRHFNTELKAASERGHLNGSLTTLGPAVIVFQETTHTIPLRSEQPSKEDSLGITADAMLRERFEEYGHNIDAFSCVQYIGTQTAIPPTDFGGLRKAILDLVRNSSVRSPRPPVVILSALKVLNDKFSGAIEATVPSTFPDEYFTCSTHCLSCDARCSHTMNHSKDNIQHFCETRCRYQHQYDNELYTCKTCYGRGEEVLVVPKTSASNDTSWMGLFKYAWSGYVLECPNCGIIYRSREHWYGNLDPEQTAVRTEIRHVWPGGCTVLQGTHNAARRVVDGLSSVIETVGSVSARPTQLMTQWMTDRIAPAYWRPNAEINVCRMCEHPFGESEKIHHCRVCGEGFCDDCSAHRMPVPERGWGEKPVRVCEPCYVSKCQDTERKEPSPEAEEPVTARKMGEVMQSTFSVLGSAMQYPLGFMVDAARPSYWVPDSDIIDCSSCQVNFTAKMRKHHCRACGQGVCSDCSLNRCPVPSRGWDEPVRICDVCNKKQNAY